MIIVRIIDYLRDRIKGLRTCCLVVLGLLVVIDAIPALVDKHHAHTWAEHLPGFWSLFGLGAGILFILGALWYGSAGITTREDYYE